MKGAKVKNLFLINIMELLQLKYFCSAAETENFTQAAKEHNVPPSSISHSIKRLEKEMGVSLFDRNANGVKLNERGKTFYLGVKSSLSMLNDTKKKVCDEEISGSINLLVESSRGIVNEGINLFREKHKNISFFIDHGQYKDWEKYDLVITDNFPFRKNYKTFSLIKDKMVLAMNRNHPLASKDSILIKDLENERMITTTNDSALCTLTRWTCGDGGFEPNFVIQSDDPYYLMQYIEMGLGIGMIPLYSWSTLISDEICLREIDDLHKGRKTKSTLICYNTQKYMTKLTKSFVDTLIEIKNQYYK